MRYFKLNEPDVSFQLFDNEVLAINLKTGNYYSLQETSGVIFRLLMDGSSSEAALNTLTTVYEVDPVVLKNDFEKLLTTIISEHLIIETSEQLTNKPIEWLNSIPKKYVSPVLETYNDMQDLLLLDPIHEVDVKKGWPNKK